MSNQKFIFDITRFAEKSKLSLGQAARGIKIALFNGVIRDSRVDTGRFRGNWQTSTGYPITGVSILRYDNTAQGSDGGQAQEDVINTVTAFDVDYITNNLAYAAVLNERDGIIDKNIARLDRNVKEAAASVR